MAARHSTTTRSGCGRRGRPLAMRVSARSVMACQGNSGEPRGARRKHVLAADGFNSGPAWSGREFAVTPDEFERRRPRISAMRQAHAPNSRGQDCVRASAVSLPISSLGRFACGLGEKLLRARCLVQGAAAGARILRERAAIPPKRLPMSRACRDGRRTPGPYALQPATIHYFPAMRCASLSLAQQG